jgi:hypothetical protein
MKMDQQFFVCIKEFISTYSHTTFYIVYFRVFRITKYNNILSLWSWTLYEVTVIVKVWKKRYFKPRKVRGRDTV